VSVRSSVDPLGKRRIRYKDAGQIMRAVLDRANAIRPPLGARDRAVLDVVLVLTVSYSKTTDSTTLQRVAEAAYATEKVHGRDRERVSKSLDRLDAHRLITVTRTGYGRGARLIVSIHESLIPPESAALSDSEIPPESAALSDDAIPPRGGTNTPPRGARKSRAERGAPRSYLEGSEMRARAHAREGARAPAREEPPLEDQKPKVKSTNPADDTRPPCPGCLRDLPPEGVHRVGSCPYPEHAGVTLPAPRAPSPKKKPGLRLVKNEPVAIGDVTTDVAARQRRAATKAKPNTGADHTDHGDEPW